MAASAQIAVLLPLLFVNVLCNSKKSECEFASESNTIKPFYASSRPALPNSLPCTFKVANIKCGSIEAEVTARNGLNKKGRTYLSDVFVKTTTHSEDGKTTYQTSSLSMDAFAKVIFEGYVWKSWRFNTVVKIVAKKKSKAMWKWSWNGDRKPSKKLRLLAKHNKKTKSTYITLDKLTVTVRHSGRAVVISCADKLSASEDLSQTLCGSPDDTKADEAAWTSGLARELRLVDLDQEEQADYWFLAKHSVQQTNPLCEEASGLVRGGQCSLQLGELGSHLHECRELAYSRCVSSAKLESLQVYVACLRVLCGAEEPTPKDSCTILSQAEASCRGNSVLRAVLSRTGCSALSTDTTTASPTASQKITLAGEACSDTSECGPYAECTGNPAQCSCKEGYISDHGRCGLAVGKKQSAVCQSNDQCVSHTTCSSNRCLCLPDYMVNHDDSLCYKRVGETCAEDAECMKDAVCAGGVCACKPGRQLGANKGYSYQPEVYCYLNLGESCQTTDDCGLNAECTGSPAVCTCPEGYVTENGRCGKPVGEKCSSSQQCVTGAYCYMKCRCNYGYQTTGSFCTRLETCKYSSDKQGTQVTRFDATVSEIFDPLPCRYNMADIQCGTEHAVVTLDNSEKHGVVTIGHVTVNVTTVGADGSVTSQTNVLSPDSSSESTVGSVTVSLLNKGRALAIVCSNADFRTRHDYPHTFCGGPRQIGTANNVDAGSDTLVDPRQQAAIEHDIVALIRQKVQQSDSLCQEASDIASSECRNLPRLMYEIRYNQIWCLKKNKKEIDQMKYYVAALRAVCGAPTEAQNPALNTCDTILHAAGYCGNGEHSLTTMNDLLRMANCGTTFTPTTTAPPPSRGYGDPDWK